MNVFITGVSGYVARVTLPYLFDDDEITLVHGLDVRAPAIDHPKFVFSKGDVRDNLESVMKGADVVVHMAFILGEIRDKNKIYDINENGTRRVLEAVKANGIRRLVVASSICAYGVHRNRGIITEDTQLKGNPESYYSHTKHLVEKMLDRFEEDNPEVTVTRLRPAILCGAETDNFFIDLLSPPVVFYPGSNPEGIPLVHEDDVGKAFHTVIKTCAPGAFNLASGNISFKRMGKIIGKKVVPLPYFLVQPLSDIGYRLGLVPISSHWTVLSRYPFHLSCDKAKSQLGWVSSHTAEESFREMVAAWKK